MKNLKVLISAYACRPGKGSEPGVGWNLVRELVKYHRVWVITREDNRQAIEAELATNPLPGLEFIYCELPWIQKLNQNQRIVHLHYYFWQLKAYFVARRLHQSIGFDLVHHVTYVRYSAPSFLSLLPIPFIWGPVGGGESAPKAFWEDFSFRAKVYETVRGLWRWIGEQDPFVRLTIKNSAVIRATTKDTVERLHKLGAKNVEISPESGLPVEDITNFAQYKLPQETPIRFISMGRLLHWKGFHLGLRAFAAAELTDAEYWICGDGIEQERLIALANNLGITKQVKFWGRLPRAETMEKLGQCHVLVHPSLHDSGGWVCIEAMATGRPVICLDLGGPGTQITESTGIKIPALTPKQVVNDMAKAMKKLAQDSQLRMQMGQAGQKRVQAEFAWEVKGDRLAQLYDKMVG